ncbi:hypothetical protein GS532_22445 [Rhodococcus hoagii]|nr:hypothetical protein [Prescottella equi]
MSDVTVESLLEHADWIDGCGHGLGPGEALRAEAARLEAESARDGEAEKLAEDLAFAYCLGFGHDADEFKWNPGGRGHDAWLAVARQVLVLAADGRLLPEGGTVLTEEQVTDIRTILPGFGGRAAEAAHARLHAFFKAPAEPVPDSGPDGTPEKPWPTWQDVPEGVRYVSSDGCYCFVNRNGSRFPAGQAGESKFRSSFSDVVMDSLAPFVRVDGDKA